MKIASLPETGQAEKSAKSAFRQLGRNYHIDFENFGIILQDEVIACSTLYSEDFFGQYRTLTD